MNKLFKIIILGAFLILNTNFLSAKANENCSDIENLAKKLKCKLSEKTKGATSKLNNATEKITSKKTLADFFKKKK